jgi:hypothetical protein
MQPPRDARRLHGALRGWGRKGRCVVGRYFFIKSLMQLSSMP